MRILLLLALASPLTAQSSLTFATAKDTVRIPVTYGAKVQTRKVTYGTPKFSRQPPETVYVAAPASACTADSVTMVPGDSLQAKVDAQPTGTAFRFCPGVYRMQTITPKTGMTFTGDSGAVMSGAKVIAGPWTDDGSGHWYVGGQTQQGTLPVNVVCQTAHPGCGLPEQVFVNDHLYEHMTTLAACGAGKWFFDYTADKIYLCGFNPTDSTVETSVTQSAFGGSATGVRIAHLTVQRYAGARPGVVVNNSTAASWTIDTGTVIRDVNGVAVACGTNGIVRSVTVVHAGQMGYKAKGTGCLIYGSVFDSSNTAGHGMGGAGEAGSGKAAGTINFVFRRDTSRWNDGPGVWVDIDNVNPTIDSSVVDDNAWRGIFCEISYGCVIRWNTVRRNGYAIPSETIGACDGAGILASSSRDVEVDHNVVEDNRNGICAQETDRVAAIPALGAHDLVNLSVHDNVVTQLDGGRAAGATDQDPNANPYSVAANNRWRSNTYHRTPGTTKWRWSPNVDVTETAWRAVQDSASTFGP